jgi:ureidoglycolate lyase
MIASPGVDGTHRLRRNLMPRVVVAQPLDPEAYRPFGDVIAANRAGVLPVSANEGTAQKFERLAALDNLREGKASLHVSLFRCSPGRLPMEIALLERHLRSTQIFIPMIARGFLVVVASPDVSGEAPDLSTLAAFLAGPGQGISYRPGIWHHPMIALDEVADFACFVHEDGTEDDCEIVRYPERERAKVVRNAR